MSKNHVSNASCVTQGSPLYHFVLWFHCINPENSLWVSPWAQVLYKKDLHVRWTSGHRDGEETARTLLCCSFVCFSLAWPPRALIARPLFSMIVHLSKGVAQVFWQYYVSCGRSWGHRGQQAAFGVLIVLGSDKENLIPAHEITAWERCCDVVKLN